MKIGSAKQNNPGKSINISKIKHKKDFDYRRFLFGILALAFALRMLFLNEISNSPFSKTLFSDARIYFDHANNMVKNNSFFGSEVFFISPLYTYFLALIITLFNDAIFFTRILQIILSTTTIYFIYLIGKNLHSEKIGIIAAFISAFYPLFIFYSSSLLLETLQVFVISFLFFLISKNQDEPVKNHWFLVGIILGLASLLRTNVLLFFPVLIWGLYLVYKRHNFALNSFYKNAFYFLIGTAIPIIPITIQNYAAEKEITLVNSNVGISFYLGNNPNATGIHNTPDNYYLFFDLSGKNYAERELNRPVSFSEASSYWLTSGLDYISSEPLNAMELFGKKLLLFFSDDENPQSSIMGMNFFKKNYSSLLKFPLPGFYVILILSILGIFLHPQKNHTYKIILFLLFTYLISIILFFVDGRFRLAITPVLIVFSASGINELWIIVREKKFKRLAVPGIVVLGMITLNFTVTPKFNSSDYDAYAGLGNSYYEKKQYDDALNYYKKSLALKEDPGTYVLIGNVYSVQKDVNNAMRAYKKAVEINPDYVLAYFNVGILYTQLTSFENAIKAFKKAIELEPKFKDGYKNLAVIYYMIEDYNNSLYYFKRVLELTKDINEKSTISRDIEEIKQKIKMTE